MIKIKQYDSPIDIYENLFTYHLHCCPKQLYVHLHKHNLDIRNNNVKWTLRIAEYLQPLNAKYQWKSYE